jgi:thiol:disulfide interchange protein
MNLPVAVVLAFLAGLILNVMPCVLPVLGIKILAFAEGRARSRRETVLRSGAFAAGMMAVFVGLATLAAVAGFSWGQQFQTPAMLAGIVILIVIFALGMFDTYIIPVPSRLAALGETGGKGYLGDGLKGMFTTILATPCSGPLLGATLAWTLRQPTMVIYAVFIAIGAGMALPYVLLASSSRLARLLPKPGPWMEDFRRVMGFLLLGFAVYLMTGLPRDMVVSTVGLCVAVAFALFLYGRVAPFGTGPGRKAAGAATALLIVAFGWYVMVDLWYGSISERARASTARTIRWEPFTPKRLTEAHMSGRHVVIDFTAAWCMNCQFNKVSVLHSDKVAGLIEEKEVLALKADITRHNAAAESLLHHLGSRSVPFFALFPGDDPYRPIVMRDILRKKRVVEALEGLAERP